MAPQRTPRRYYSKPLVFYFSPRYNNPTYSKPWSQKWMMLLPEKIKNSPPKSRRQDFSYNYTNASCEAATGCLTIRDQQYILTITSTLVPDAAWEEIAAKFSKRALWEVYLIEDSYNYTSIPSFATIVESLVPPSFFSLKVKCSCNTGEKVNQGVCTHVRGAWGVVASKLEYNPWLLFQFRGRSQKQILEMIHQNRSRKIFQQHENLQTPIPAPSDNHPDSVRGNGNTAFWRYEEPISPIIDQSSTAMKKEQNNGLGDEAEPILIGGCDVGKMIAKYFERIPTNIEKRIQEIVRTIASFPPVQVSTKSDLEAFRTGLKAYERPHPVPVSIPVPISQASLSDPSQGKNKNPKLQQHRIIKDKATRKIQSQQALKTETKPISDEKIQIKIPISQVKGRSYVDGDMQIFHIRIDQLNQIDDQPKSRFIEIHPLSSLQDLGRAILKAENLSQNNTFEFYEGHKFPTTSSLAISAGLVVLPAKVSPVLDVNKIKIKDVFPREGERMFFRPDPKKALFNQIELHRICLRSTQATGATRTHEGESPHQSFQSTHSESGIIAKKITTISIPLNPPNQQILGVSRKVNEYGRICFGGKTYFVSPSWNGQHLFVHLEGKKIIVQDTSGDKIPMSLKRLPKPNDGPLKTPATRPKPSKTNPKCKNKSISRVSLSSGEMRNADSTGRICFGGKKYYVDRTWGGKRLLVTPARRGINVQDARGQKIPVAAKILPKSPSFSSNAPSIKIKSRKHDSITKKLPKSRSPHPTAGQRRVETSGRISFNGKRYYVERSWGGQILIITREGNAITAHDARGQKIPLSLKILPKSPLSFPKTCSKSLDSSKTNIPEKSLSPPRTTPPPEGFRRVESSGRISFGGKKYYVDRSWGGQSLFVKRVGDTITAHDARGQKIQVFPRI